MYSYSFPDRSRNAFTIIEVLCALILSAALMVAMLGVVAGMGRRADVLTEESKQPAALFEELLQADIANSQRISLSANQLVLTGYLSRNRQSGKLIGKPADVTYELLETKNNRILQRREHLLGQLSNVPDGRNLALANFGRFEVKLAGDATHRESYAGPTPRQFAILVTTSNQQHTFTFVK